MPRDGFARYVIGSIQGQAHRGPGAEPDKDLGGVSQSARSPKSRDEHQSQTSHMCNPQMPEDNACAMLIPLPPPIPIPLYPSTTSSDHVLLGRSIHHTSAGLACYRYHAAAIASCCLGGGGCWDELGSGLVDSGDWRKSTISDCLKYRRASRGGFSKQREAEPYN